MFLDMKETAMPDSIILEVRGKEPAGFTNLVLDFTGMLALDGVVFPGVSERLQALSQCLRVTVLMADAFGRAGKCSSCLDLIIVPSLHPQQAGSLTNGRGEIHGCP
jgi:hypothetical protein